MNISLIEQTISARTEFGRLAAGGLAMVFCYIALSIVATPTGELDFNFQEGGTVTALSALFLSMASAMGFITYYIGFQTGDAKRYMFLLFAGALAFLAIDEQIQLHEAIDHFILTPQLGESPASRNWNDLIVIGYGVGGLAVLWAFRDAILSSRRFALLLATAFAMYAFHTAIDSIVIQQTAWKVVPEESFKVLCGYFLFLAMASGLTDALDRLFARRRR